MANRAILNNYLENLKSVLEEVFEYLESKTIEGWYPSIMVERRYFKNFEKNKKQKKFSENLSLGANLRIFNGESLVELATDDLSKESLISICDELVVKASLKSGHGNVSFYKSPTWDERLVGALDAEIMSQIPDSRSKDTWVHFGSSFDKPIWTNNEEAIKYNEELYSRTLKIDQELEAGDLAKDLDFVSCRLQLGSLDYIFMDPEVKLTQTLLRNRSLVIILKNSDRGLAMNGGLGGLETLALTDKELSKAFSDVRKQAQAGKLTPGRYKLLMGPSVTGVFAHEAFGHTQEGDTWAKGRSKAKELYETQESVGNKHATILNNPAIYKNAQDDFAAWGSYYFDEEGWFASSQYLVKEGKLMPPMTNLTSAIRLGVPRTSNGKRESWMNATYTRQTNTYVTPGTLSFDELIDKVDYGFLGTNSAGGMEDPKGMGIQVGIEFLEEIKDGKLTGKTFKAPNGGSVQMTGYVPDYLNAIIDKTKIDAFNEFEGELEHPWNDTGGCGKYHKELVVAGCGGTYILINDALLG